MKSPLAMISCWLLLWCAPLLAQPAPLSAPPLTPSALIAAPSVHVLGPTELAAALARYAHEPSVQRVIEATLDAAPRGRSEDLASRARTAGWVPRVGLRARRGQGVDLASSTTDETLRLSSDADVTLEASLTFELDRVVFRSEEVALSRQARADEQSVQARVRDAIGLYFERRRVQLERDLEGDPKLQRSVRIAEIEALLDVFTNGAFRRMLGSSAWKAVGSNPASASSSPPKSRPTAIP